MRHIGNVVYLLLFATLDSPAAGRATDVCELGYVNGQYRLYKGGKLFSPGIASLDDALSRFRGVVDEGICRSRIGTCSLRFESRGGRYSVFKNGKRFTAGFASLRAAEALLGELAYNSVCVTPDADH